ILVEGGAGRVLGPGRVVVDAWHDKDEGDFTRQPQGAGPSHACARARACRRSPPDPPRDPRGAWRGVGGGSRGPTVSGAATWPEGFARRVARVGREVPLPD